MATSENVNTRPRLFKAFCFLAVALVGVIGWSAMASPVWGFYGHRKINYMAVFTMPIELIPYFKEHIGFISAHAVDPDIRRYATDYEAVRHYIDIDHWGERPFDEVPRMFSAAIAKYSMLRVEHASGDTSLYDFGYALQLDSLADVTKIDIASRSQQEAFEDFLYFVNSDMSHGYYEDEWLLPYESVKGFKEIRWSEGAQVSLVDRFSKYGILPFYLKTHYEKIVKSFADPDQPRLLNLLAEMGHYLGDAHVPLHTTENYNGQMTNQLGIHAFWESRIPELQAEENYDFFVGKAKYIEDKPTYFWKVVEESYNLVEDLLRIERELSETFPKDQQYCHDDRLDRNIRTQCPEYALAYEKALGGTIERRMRESVIGLGSIWYSAWVDAGKPDLILNSQEIKDTSSLVHNPAIKTRPH